MVSNDGLQTETICIVNSVESNNAIIRRKNQLGIGPLGHNFIDTFFADTISHGTNVGKNVDLSAHFSNHTNSRNGCSPTIAVVVGVETNLFPVVDAIDNNLCRLESIKH